MRWRGAPWSATPGQHTRQGGPVNIVLTQAQQDQAVLDIVRASGALCKMPENKLTRASLTRLRKAGLLRFSRDPGTTNLFVFPEAAPERPKLRVVS